MLQRELRESIECIRRDKPLTPHRREQINRVLRWFEANWDAYEELAREWSYEHPELSSYESRRSK